MCGLMLIVVELILLILYLIENKDVCCECNYIGQLLMILYKIDGIYMYQINKDYNGCLFCYVCMKVEEMCVIVISFMYYVDCDGY